MLCYQLFSENLTNFKEGTLFTISFQYLGKYSIPYMAQLRRKDVSQARFIHSIKKPDTVVSFIKYFWNLPKKSPPHHFCMMKLSTVHNQLAKIGSVISELKLKAIFKGITFPHCEKQEGKVPLRPLPTDSLRALLQFTK